MDWSSYSSSSALNVVQSLGPYGALQVGSLPPEALDRLREFNRCTAPDTVASAEGIFSPRVMKLLYQAYPGETPQLLVKLGNGVALVVGPQHKIASCISDEDMCRPAGKEEDSDEEGGPPPPRAGNISGVAGRVMMTPIVGGKPPKTVYFAVVHDPKAPPAKPLFLVHHDGHMEPYEVSRFAPVESAVSQLVRHIPLNPEPRVLLSAHSLGTATGRELVGPDAHLMKQAFLQALREQSHGQFFHQPMDLSETLSNLLMIRKGGKPVCCALIKDGLVGYRTREDKKKSLLFAVHSPDFHRARPDPVSDSKLKVIKLNYTKKDPMAPRIYVHTEEDAPGRDDGFAVLTDRMNFEDVRSRMERVFRVTHREDLGCGSYHPVCLELARKHLACAGHALDPHTDACVRLLQTQAMF